MNSQIETIELAKTLVDSFKPFYTNSEGILTRNLFPDDTVGKKNGIHKSLWHKRYSELKPNELKYIIKYLHNVSDEMLLSSTLAYLRYYKTKQRNQYESEYEKLLRHYSVENHNNKTEVDATNDMKLYLLDISIGSSRFYKVGISTNVHKRILRMRSELSTRYDMVSTSVNLIKSWIDADAEEHEEKYISEIETKNKYYFKGSTECFTSKELKEKILHQMNHNYHLEW